MTLFGESRSVQPIEWIFTTGLMIIQTKYKTEMKPFEAIEAQRQKYLASARALLAGKFLRVRKVFARRL